MIQDITYRKIHILNKAFDNSFRVFIQGGFENQTIRVYPFLKPMEDTFKEIDIIMNYETVQANIPEI